MSDARTAMSSKGWRHVADIPSGEAVVAMVVHEGVLYAATASAIYSVTIPQQGVK